MVGLINSASRYVLRNLSYFKISLIFDHAFLAIVFIFFQMLGVLAFISSGSNSCSISGILGMFLTTLLVVLTPFITNWIGA
jgi:hypothetical protein